MGLNETVATRIAPLAGGDLGEFNRAKAYVIGSGTNIISDLAKIATRKESKWDKVQEAIHSRIGGGFKLTHREERETAITALSYFPESPYATAVLGSLLFDTNECGQAARRLSEFGNLKIPYALAALKSSNSWVRGAGAVAINNIDAPSPETILILRELILETMANQGGVAAAAIQTLETIGNWAEIRDVLLMAANNGDEDSKKSALAAMEPYCCSDPNVREAFLMALRCDNRYVQVRALRILVKNQCDGADLAEILVDLSESENEILASEAVEALTEFRKRQSQ